MKKYFKPFSKLVDLDKKVPISETKILLGEYNGFQRYDIYHHNFAKQIERLMRQAFWTPEEISLLIDRENFKELPEHAREVLINNLLFQTLMDSAQNRGLDSIMSELVTSSEWEAVFKSQSYFELIHSLSYSHILREMFSSDATEIFDRIYLNEHIKHRTDREIAAYDEIKKYLNGVMEVDHEGIEKKILRLCIYVYFLEGLKFYISFLTTYAINNAYNDAIPGVTKIIKLINFDEDMHVAVFGGLLNILRKNEHEGFTHLFKDKWFEKEAYKIVNQIVEDELEWAEYLLSFGPIPSLTKEVLINFMQYYANVRLENIGLEPLFKDNKKSDIVDWFIFYKNINKDNTAQQEAKALNYNIGTMEFDYGDKDLNDIIKKLMETK